MEYIKCPFCGATLDSDSRFCAKCGKSIDITKDDSISKATPVNPSNNLSTETIPVNPSNENQKEDSTTRPPKKTPPKQTAGLIFGIFFIILGLLRIGSALLSSATFGADFYTYVYQGITAIEISLGWIIFAIGVMILLFTRTDKIS